MHRLTSARLPCARCGLAGDEYSLLLLVQQGKISEEDLREVREAFDALDADGSGKLTRSDLEMLRAGNLEWMQES